MALIFVPRNNKQPNTMKATTFIHALASHNWDTIPTQVMHICDRADLVKIIGTEGKIYAIGMNGIPESNYLYLYPDADRQQADLYEGLKEAAEKWENSSTFVDAVCSDAAGQCVVIINIMEA